MKNRREGQPLSPPPLPCGIGLNAFCEVEKQTFYTLVFPERKTIQIFCFEFKRSIRINRERRCSCVSTFSCYYSFNESEMQQRSHSFFCIGEHMEKARMPYLDWLQHRFSSTYRAE